MAPNFSRLTARTDVKIGLAASAALCAWYIRNITKSSKNKNDRTSRLSPEEQIQYMIKEKAKKGPKAKVDARFFAELKVLWKIMFPGVWSKETGLMFLIAFSLVSRSICDLWLIQHSTLIEGSIISMNLPEFKSKLAQFFIAMPMISLVNNLLRWSIGEAKLRIRTNLTLHMYQQYLKGFTYYQVTNLDNRIANADQVLTTDIDKFCETIIDLYSNISKPMLDIGIYLYRLTTNLGASTPGIMVAYLVVSGIFLTLLRKPTARMTVQEQKLEGEFRYVNARLITNSEEIAFYQGNHREQLTVLASFYKLTRHLRNFLNFRVIMGFIDNIVAKFHTSSPSRQHLFGPSRKKESRRRRWLWQRDFEETNKTQTISRDDQRSRKRLRQLLYSAASLFSIIFNLASYLFIHAIFSQGFNNSLCRV